jgi:hypothetical protein
VPFIQHYKVIHSGYFGPVGAPVEFWSHSLAVSAVSPFLVRSDLPAIAASCRTAWSSLASSINNNVRLTRTRVVSIGPDGKYNRDASGAYVLGDDTTEAAGGGTTIQPPQLALAVTLTTDRTDALGKGRFYLPSPVIGTLASDLRMTATASNAVLANVKAYLAGVRGAFPATATTGVVVASGGSLAKAVPPQNRLVTGVRIGRVVDTMRSRRADLQESYVVGTFP